MIRSAICSHRTARLPLFRRHLSTQTFRKTESVPDPESVINGPSAAVTGDIVFLTSSQSTGTRFLWKLTESPPYLDSTPMTVVNNGRDVFLGTRPGSYKVVLVVSNSEGVMSASTYKIVMRGRDDETRPEPNPPRPNPNPPQPGPKPPEPDPFDLSSKLGVKKFVFNEVIKVPS